MRHWNENEIEKSFESMSIQNVRSLSRIRLQDKKIDRLRNVVSIG